MTFKEKVNQLWTRSSLFFLFKKIYFKETLLPMKMLGIVDWYDISKIDTEYANFLH